MKTQKMQELTYVVIFLLCLGVKILTRLTNNSRVGVVCKLRWIFKDDDAEKSTVSYTVLTCLKQHLHNTKREDPTKSTSVVPAKYPPKVKLELFS